MCSGGTVCDGSQPQHKERDGVPFDAPASYIVLSTSPSTISRPLRFFSPANMPRAGLLRRISPLLVTAYLLFHGLTWMWVGMQFLCGSSLVSSFIPFCGVVKPNLTVWAALPLLLGSQSNGMEQVLNQTNAHSDIVVDLLDARVASVDLSILVHSSNLEYRIEISSLIEQLAHDALDLNRGLQHLSAKIAAGFDRYVSNLQMEDAYSRVSTP